jgi:hypothetical protein
VDHLIHPCVLALHRKLPIAALASMTWVYPTPSEAVRKAAQSRYDQLLARPTVGRLVGLARRLKGSG